MTALVFDTHAELEQRRRYTDPTDCTGRMLVVVQDDNWWELECDECRFSVAIRPAAFDSSHRERMHAERVQRWREESGMPAELRGLPWGEVAAENADALAAAQRWATQNVRSAGPPRSQLTVPNFAEAVVAGTAPVRPIRGLLLTGSVGVGKTWIAAAAAWELMERRPVRWTTVQKLLNDLNRDFGDDALRRAVDLVDGTDALVLDDIDKASSTEGAAKQLFAAVDSRVTAGAPLLVTTNLDLDGIAEKFPDPFGDSMASRIAQHCEICELVGTDRRLARFAA